MPKIKATCLRMNWVTQCNEIVILVAVEKSSFKCMNLLMFLLPHIHVFHDYTLTSLPINSKTAVIEGFYRVPQNCYVFYRTSWYTWNNDSNQLDQCRRLYNKSIATSQLYYTYISSVYCLYTITIVIVVTMITMAIVYISIVKSRVIVLHMQSHDYTRTQPLKIATLWPT